MKPDGQNLVISFVNSKWLLPELLFSDCWSRGTKTLGTRLQHSSLFVVVALLYKPVAFNVNLLVALFILLILK